MGGAGVVVGDGLSPSRGATATPNHFTTSEGRPSGRASEWLSLSLPPFPASFLTSSSLLPHSLPPSLPPHSFLTPSLPLPLCLPASLCFCVCLCLCLCLARFIMFCFICIGTRHVGAITVTQRWTQKQSRGRTDGCEEQAIGLAVGPTLARSKASVSSGCQEQAASRSAQRERHCNTADAGV